MLTLTKVEFKNYKAMSDFSLHLRETNLLVGPNNCGKSTIIGAFRVLDRAIRHASSKSPTRIDGPTGTTLGYQLDTDSLPISLENVHTDYGDDDTSVSFQLSNGNALLLYIPRRGGCFCIPRAASGLIRTPSQFRREFPVNLAVVPVLEPLEQVEPLLQERTVSSSLGTHRASRHFRNYWRLNPEGFAQFAEMVSETWPGMKIFAPEFVAEVPPRIVMFCEEHGITRELCWAGSGFQVWCQLLTHLSRARDATCVVVDEPEIYLHPDLQRQLLELLRDLGPSVVVATHSTEMIAEASPDEIAMIDKSKRQASRITNAEGLQGAIDLIGSVHNITLTRLARSRKVLFVEGQSDFKIIRRFAKKLNLRVLAQDSAITPVESGGFSSWRQVRDAATMLERMLGTSLMLSAVYDRDFWPSEEIDEISSQLLKVVEFAHFHQKKELENYMLHSEVLARVAEKHGVTDIDFDALLDQITSSMRDELLAQYISKRTAFLQRRGRDHATAGVEVIRWFGTQWATIDSRLAIVGGKKVLAELRSIAHERHGLSLTDARIIDAFRPAEIAPDLKTCLERLSEFAQMQYTSR